MKKYRVEQTLILGYVEIPDDVTDISSYLDLEGLWPDDEEVERVDFFEVE